jgi:DNA gyrase subunit A
MIINKSGLTIRMAIEDLRVMGRATQGVKLINLKGKDSIAAVTKVMKDDVAEIVMKMETSLKQNNRELNLF